MRILRWEFKYI